MRGYQKKIVKRVVAIVLAACLSALSAYGILRIRFPRPYFDSVSESGVESALVYAVMKAESGFREDAESQVGAKGLMQLMPSTAAFICELENIPFDVRRLTEGEYNVTLGTRYLRYLLNKFCVAETAIAAYNAGEGVVLEWLRRADYSSDGKCLSEIPYAETSKYVKKVVKFRKFYRFLYH